MELISSPGQHGCILWSAGSWLRQLRDRGYQAGGAVLLGRLAATEDAGDGEAGESIGAGGALAAPAAPVAVVAVVAQIGRRCGRRGTSVVVVESLAVVVVEAKSLLPQLLAAIPLRTLHRRTEALEMLLLHLQLLLLLLLLLLLAGGREGMLQQGGMCGPVGGMQVMAKGVERMMQGHRMTTQSAQVVLQMVVQHRRRNGPTAGAVMEVIAIATGSGSGGRAGGRVGRIGAMGGRGRRRAAVGGAGRRAGQQRTVAGGGAQGTWLRTGDHTDVNFGLGGRHGLLLYLLYYILYIVSSIGKALLFFRIHLSVLYIFVGNLKNFPHFTRGTKNSLRENAERYRWEKHVCTV